MPGVFISHSFADKAFVDEFVDTVVRLGCGVQPKDIFYSSGDDTGVPSGKDLNSYVRDQVGDSRIVIAIISPSFQTRPFCVAELGAAWSRVDNLFPIAVPGMPRTDMEGVLSGMLVRYLDDSAALDELHTRVSAAKGGDPTDARTWGSYKQKWLANVASHAERLPEVKVATVAELEVARADLAGTQQALRDSEEERRRLVDQVERLKVAKSPEEVADILQPDDEVERFKQVRARAVERLRKLGSIVSEAMWYDLFEQGMPWPDRWTEEDRLDRAREAKREGVLTENAYDRLVPDREVKVVDEAYAAVEDLRRMLEQETSEEFYDWFEEEYGMPPKLKRKRLWDDLL